MTTIKTIDHLTAPITGWWVTSDEEHYEAGPLDTREEALLAAMEIDAYAIARCTQQPVRVAALFDAPAFLEQAEEANEDWHNEDGDPVLDFSLEVIADLQATVRAAIDAWQVKHQLAPLPYMFFSVDDEEAVAERVAGEGVVCA